jgi:hypothetical protein
MRSTEFDKEYYVMDIDGRDEYPMLAWGEMDDTPFLQDYPIDISELEFPLVAEFDEPYPSKYIMPDFLKLSSEFACTTNLKKLFETNTVFGIEFFPLETVRDNKKKEIKGYHATHIWNKLPAIDKSNYIGGKPNKKGHINDLKKFSLNITLLEEIPLEKRLIFELMDSPAIYIIHQSLYKLIISEKFSGFSFFRVDDWDDNAIFRNGINIYI